MRLRKSNPRFVPSPVHNRYGRAHAHATPCTHTVTIQRRNLRLGQSTLLARLYTYKETVKSVEAKPTKINRN